MRVTHVNLSKDLRGGERQLLTLVDALRTRVDQTLVVRRDSFLHRAVASRVDLDVVAIPSSPVLAAFALRNADIAHIHEGRSVRAGAIAAHLFGTPYVITRRMPRKPHAHVLTRHCYRRAAKITAVSNTVTEVLRDYDASLPLQTIYDYVQPLMAHEQRVEKLRRESRFRIIVGHVGELVDEHKGQSLLVRVARRLQHSHPDVGFWFVGQGRDEDKLRESAADLANVRFCGWTDNVADYYAAMDIFAFPSRFEALGSANLEAMSFGLPIVAACVDGIPEIVKHERNGLLFRCGDVGDLTNQLTRLLDSVVLRQALGREAGRTVERFLSGPAAEKFHHIYRRYARADTRTKMSRADLGH